MRIPLGIFVVALLIGFVGSRFFKMSSSEVISTSIDRREREPGHDRRLLKQRMEASIAEARKVGAFDPFSDEWADWTEAELQAALEEGLNDPAMVLNGEERQLIDILFTAWCRKNLANAIAWWETRPSESMLWDWPVRLELRGRKIGEWKALNLPVLIPTSFLDMER